MVGYLAYAWVALPNVTGSRVRVIFVGLQGRKERMYYFGVTALGALQDEAVKLYNKATMRSLATQRADAERVEASMELLKHKWPLFSEPPPGPVMFPRDPDEAKQYILGLTWFAKQKQRAAHPTVVDDGQLHIKAIKAVFGRCVCEWISDDRDQLVCGWCDKGKRIKQTSKAQFCEHINGVPHGKKCATALLSLLSERQHCPECHR